MKMETCQSGGAEPHQYKLRWGFSPHCPHGSYAYGITYICCLFLNLTDNDLLKPQRVTILRGFEDALLFLWTVSLEPCFSVNRKLLTFDKK